MAGDPGVSLQRPMMFGKVIVIVHSKAAGEDKNNNDGAPVLLPIFGDSNGDLFLLVFFYECASCHII